MRLHVLSDLHFEFDDIPAEIAETADVVVLAGDIALRTAGVEWAASVARSRPVIYVPGNHEYYGASIPDLTAKLKARGAELGIHVLDGDTVVIDGVRFLGATLWTDFALFADPTQAMAAAQLQVLDYRRIRVSPAFRKLRPGDTASMHRKTRRWLQHELEAGHLAGAVIVTHHAPSMRSVNPEFLGDPVTASYASGMDEFVQHCNATLWIHGHTHYCIDYTLGATRVISNARGYPDEPSSGFREDLVVGVDVTT